jgi:hypothetical protein
VDGKLHRIDGPAIDDGHGHREWWIDGQRHRTDGPAISWTSGYQEWWLNGKREITPAQESVKETQDENHESAH